MMYAFCTHNQEDIQVVYQCVCHLTTILSDDTARYCAGIPLKLFL